MSQGARRWAATQRIHRTPKAVLMYLAECSNREELAWPSQKTISEATGLSVRTVRYALDYLEESGFIERVMRTRDNGGRTSDRVRLLVSDAELVFVGYAQWYRDRGARGAAAAGGYRQVPAGGYRQVPAGGKEEKKEPLNEGSAAREVREVLSLSALDDARRLLDDIPRLDDDTLWRMYVKAQSSNFESTDPARNQANVILASAIGDEIRKRLLER